MQRSDLSSKSFNQILFVDIMQIGGGVKILSVLFISMIFIGTYARGQGSTTKPAASNASVDTAKNPSASTANSLAPPQGVPAPQPTPIPTNSINGVATPDLSPASPQRAAVQQPSASPMPTPASQPHFEKKWRISAGFGYMLTNQNAQFSNATYIGGGSTVNGSASLNYGSTYVVDLEARYLPTDSWGFIGGLNYEGQRQFKSGTLQGGGYNIDLVGGSGASKVQFITLYANAAYRWGAFYLPFGLNFSNASFTQASGASGTSSASGGVGAEVGVGYMASHNVAVELYSWVTSMSLNTVESGDSINYGSGYFQSDILVLKYVF